MNIPDQIRHFLSHAKDISLGYREVNFIGAGEIEEGQLGYTVDAKGNLLISGKDGDWRDEWLVIANDEMDDPIVVDTSSPSLIVMAVAKGEGSWDPYVIADSLENFKQILALIKKISKGREYPIDLEDKPITDEERSNALQFIEEQNPGAELWYWESFLENE